MASPMEDTTRADNNAVSIDNSVLDHLSVEQKNRYEAKLQALGTCDPYTAPIELFEPLKDATSLPDFCFGDLYVYLVETPSPYTQEKMKAFKSTESYLYARAGHVNQALIWEVKDKKMFTVKAKVGACLYSFVVLYCSALLFRQYNNIYVFSCQYKAI